VHVTAAREEIRPRLTEDQIAETIKLHKGEINQCFEMGLLRDANLRGQIASSLVIEPDGHVSSVGDARGMVPSSSRDAAATGAMGKAFPDPEVVACVHERIRAIQFPPYSETGPVTAIHPISFGGAL